ncbi:metallo-beta-lactamase family protein [Pseudoalteromonas espejiana DSM 9414]|uniref:Zn-dependent metallo-hydrolase RNA specificity domain-containing protein n=1 Tax=Pseudoalteromonas espejiana TaxID=28107 RepID=A0A510Y152_9GAMM|nr:metallo-beta-lactamase family protein [Pseudoalteromonas espejiana DSM 9414]GEK56923.1 hypothetical protein PES01_37680 [Pseudoalteromonas espejiana]
MHTISCYSAHADQNGLVKFITGMRKKPSHIKIVYGDNNAKTTMVNKYKEVLGNEVKIEISK